MDDPGPPGGRMFEQEEQAMGEPRAAATRAASVGIAEFSEQLSSGVLRALDSHARAAPKGQVYKPWIWAGIWIGPNDGGGPFTGAAGGPLGGGGINQG